MKNKNRVTLLIMCLWFVLLTACNHDDNDAQNTTPPPPSGTVTGSVKDAASNTGLSDVIISVRDENDIEIENSITDSDGIYEIRLPANRQYQFIFTLAAYYQSVYSGVTVNSDETETLEAVLQIDNTISGTGSISGTLTDALTGLPLASAQIFFRAGINIQTGDIVAETTTDNNGNYSLSDTLQTGQYTIEVALNGYVNNFVTVLVLGGQLIDNQNASITPVLPGGETRIVLTWGARPFDLDSHLTGPVANNSDSRFHVFFNNKGSATSSPFSRLDVDDTASFGPETITISSQFQGTYRYYIHNFSNRDDANSTTLGDSGAKVTVYQGDQQPRGFNVPSGTGTTWEVFELNGNNLRSLNTLSRDTAFTFASARTADNTRERVEIQNELIMIENVPFK